MSAVKHIPNAITSMNLLCGVMGVIASLQGRLELAFALMLEGALFDFCDGLAARLLKAYSDIGKELDSLADGVTFGVLPSVMLWCVFGTDMALLRLAPLLIAVFSALRLAKFNLDERQHESFIGLPTPACAMFCGSLACFVSVEGTLSGLVSSCWFIPLVSLLMCFLLVSEIPMFSMKLGTGKETPASEKAKRIVFLVLCVLSAVIVIALGIHWSAAVCLAFAGYMLVNLGWYAVSGRKS